VLLGSLVRAAEQRREGEEGDRRPAPVRAVLGDSSFADQRDGDSRVGLVMLAPNFREVREVMRAAMDSDVAPDRRPRGEEPRGEELREEREALARGDDLLAMAAASPVTRVLVCGYRPGSVDLLESLAVAYPQATILFVAGATTATMRQACDDLDAHRDAVLRRGVTARGGFFEAVDSPKSRSGDAYAIYRYSYGPRRGPSSRAAPHEEANASIVVARADWSSSRVLAELPCGYGPAFDMDAVVLCADESRAGDARTLTALMKLEALFESAWAEDPGRSDAMRRLVVEVDDEDLAIRLRARFDRLHDQRVAGRDALLSVSIYALPALRAYFMFQSVVVPHFDLVFEELLGPWGMSLVPLEVAPSVAGDQRVSMQQLEGAVGSRGGTIIGLEYRDADGEDAFWIGRPDKGTPPEVAAKDISRVWGVLPDSAGENSTTRRS
jgi:hypothetical protein